MTRHVERIRNIKIVVHNENEKLEVRTYRGEYLNLMTLIYDQIYTEEFGECKGVGRCGTCHIEILNREIVLTTGGNEITTLSRSSLKTNRSRLACQIAIDETLDGLEVKVITEYEPFKGY
jgi:ferredoxin, 2Fe-2S